MNVRLVGVIDEVICRHLKAISWKLRNVTLNWEFPWNGWEGNMVNLEEKLREPIKENVRWQCVGKGEFFLSENAHNQEFMSKYPRNSSAVKFCLRRAAFCVRLWIIQAPGQKVKVTVKVLKLVARCPKVLKYGQMSENSSFLLQLPNDTQVK